MRHDPAGAALIIMLRSLKMPGMAQAVQDLHEQGSPAFEAAMPILSQLLKAEMAEREVRSTAYHMKAARFPAYKDLSAFDFSASEIREALVRQLHRCEFLDAAENVVLIGGPGTGKSHVATALGIQAIEHHRKRVRFFSTVELVNALEQEKTQGKAGKIAEALVKTDLVILDELGYLNPYTFEDALAFDNLSFFVELDGTGLIRKFRDAIADGGGATAIGGKMYLALKNGKKAEFALDVMEVENFDTIVVPRYIAEGLEWLLAQLKKKQVEILPLVKEAPPEEEVEANPPVEEHVVVEIEGADA